MSEALQRPMTLEGFLEWEERQELRYEFDGVGPVARSGGTAAHDTISINIVVAVGQRLRGPVCRVRGSNLKVKVMGRIRYPDAFVTCTPVDPKATVTDAPVVIFEVLSDSTARTDRELKKREYRSADSVTHYIMLEQDAVAATVLERDGARWIDTIAGPGDTIELASLGISIPMDELYDGLVFEDTEPVT